MSTVPPTVVTLTPQSPAIAAGDSLILEATLTPALDEDVVAIWDARDLGEFVPFPADFMEKLTLAGREIFIVFHSRTRPLKIQWDTRGVPPGAHKITIEVYRPKMRLTRANFPEFVGRFATARDVVADPIGDDEATVRVTQTPKEPALVSMRRADSPATSDQALWTAIRNSANALSFNNYNRFMDIVMCGAPDDLGLSHQEAHDLRDPIKQRLRLPFPDTDAYRQLKVATEVFVMLNCGVFFDRQRRQTLLQDPETLAAENRRHYRALQPGDIENYWRQLLRPVATQQGAAMTLPYLAIIRRKLQDVAVVRPNRANRARWLQEEEAAVECFGILMEKLTHPCFLELIWSYWHEEGMLVQTMNAITWRFQNRRGPADRDPLALLEIDPLRPLNNFIWGYIQDEQHRLTVPRRAYEYDHHYGLTLLGKAVPTVRGADSRSRFLEAFHHLLYRCGIFFKEDDDTTVVADGFPLLNALKEVHLLLTQGAHNQYGDLPWTARQEMLMQEWLLARPEFREFLPSRIMVDYPEPWMDRVETMKTLQGWTDTSIMHFRDLGVFGEQILLSIRFGAWPSVIESQNAANWARYWRPEIQGYVHAYRAATGVDLGERVDVTLPAVLLQHRLGPQRQAALPHVIPAPLPSNIGQAAPKALPR